MALSQLRARARLRLPARARQPCPIRRILRLFGAAAIAVTFTFLTIAMSLPFPRIARAEQAVLLDRIVAVVEDKTIYRSDVIVRSQAYVMRLDPKDVTPDKTRKIHREMLEKMIDELLIAAEADRAHVRTDNEEIERAIAQVSTQSKLTRAELVAEVKRQGMTFDEYKAEIRRQLIDAKWTNLKVRPAIHVPQTGTEEERQQALMALIAIERKKMLGQLRAHAHVEIRW